MNMIIQQDLEYINRKFINRDALQGSTIMLTGCAGFLGFYFLQYLVTYQQELGIKKIIGLDNFFIDKPKWLEDLDVNSAFSLIPFDVVKDDIADLKEAKNVDYIVHMASIASPSFYRQFPIQTMEANTIGLQKIIDFYKDKPIKGLLMFSTSEIYGDPTPENIPTSEEYRGNVASIGPRACYDEAKRFAETLCYVYASEFMMPITLVRPFNNYGPGMSIDDKRAPADFAKAVLKQKPIEILSDGKPTRTFCYIADAVAGYLLALTYGKFDVFNIGYDGREHSIFELAQTYAKVAKECFGYDIEVNFEQSDDENYLVDNPNRRCPIITKARNTLQYKPEIVLEVGLEKYLRFLTQN